MKHGTLFLGLLLLVLCACRRERPAPSIMFGQPASQTAADDYDLPDIQAAGELIAVTLSGPDTYYEYRGQGFGIQFMMAESFARSVGARLRMEIAPDNAALVAKLLSGEADLVALDRDTLSDNKMAGDGKSLTVCGPGWLVRKGSPQLSEAVSRWYSPDTRQQLLAAEKARLQPKAQPRRRPRPVMMDRSHGVISPYDHLFRQYAATVGWDWRLLAAQCYQESGFDPRAVSWAGACGLLQLMPATAARFGLGTNQLYDAESNVATATRYLSYLNKLFADVGHPAERISFVLAAYNGGEGHVRDAMALARRDGRDATRWNVVEPYVVGLSEPRYYRDPLVRFGYLRGSETADYVRQIQSRWASYRGAAHPSPMISPLPSSSSRTSRVRDRSAFELHDNDSVQ